MSGEPTPDNASGQWFWCLRHERVEPREGCGPADRLGPYPTREAAEHWQDQVQARNDAWDNWDE